VLKMKKFVGVIGLLGSLALCSVAIATGLIVHGGQNVTLPCVVTGSVIVDAGGSIDDNDACSSTSIQGSLDIHPGGRAELCNTHVAGALIVRQAAAGSYFAHGTVSGATRNDGSLSTTRGCDGEAGLIRSR